MFSCVTCFQIQYDTVAVIMSDTLVTLWCWLSEKVKRMPGSLVAHLSLIHI